MKLNPAGVKARMKHAHLYLAAILLLHAGITALDEAYFWMYIPDGESLAEADWMTSPALYWIPLFVLLYVWCRVDAKSRQVELPLVATFAIPLLFPVGVPYYYWRTYPRRAALVHIGLFAIFVATCIAALWIGRWLAFHYFLEPDRPL